MACRTRYSERRSLLATSVERRVMLGDTELIYLCSKPLETDEPAPILLFLRGH
ncbi:MAG: hypothetical protein U5J83_00770 [Bryobacterales bacterium]|nr:hypothetical protein [Bryobacterales bacterium]